MNVEIIEAVMDARDKDSDFDTESIGSEDSEIHLKFQLSAQAEITLNIASSIMLKIPTHRLPYLREAYERKKRGVDLYDFLHAFVNNMHLEDNDALLSIIPDLVDFFDQVDINGDGYMEWSEFVMYVIEQVVQGSMNEINEALVSFSNMHIQPAASRHSVRCSKYIPEMNRLIIGINGEVQVFCANEYASSIVMFETASPLLPKDYLNTVSSSSSTSTGTGTGSNKSSSKIHVPTATTVDKVVILDVTFLPSRDMLLVLRADLLIEFIRFSSMSKFSSDTITSLDQFKLGYPLNKITIRDIPNEDWLLFGIGTANCIEVWKIKPQGLTSIRIFDNWQIVKHTDYVRDILVIEPYNVFVSCGMDKKVHIWDLITLNYKSTRTGHTAGVQCLAYDGKSVLLAGGFDYSIIGWDLGAEINKPLFTLVGHQHVIMKIVGLSNDDDDDRCISLDGNGEMRLWETSKLYPYDKEGRQISCDANVQDRPKSFDVFRNVSDKFKALHNAVIATQGRRQYIYKIVDFVAKLSPPLAVLVSLPLLQLISVHSHSIYFWSAVSGEETKKMDRLECIRTGGELLCATLDDRGRKLIIGDSAGGVTVYNCLTGVMLKSFPLLPYSVKFIMYSPDRTVIAVAGPGDIYIFDEMVHSDKDATLRQVSSISAEVLAVAFSHKLGLIATIDTAGVLIIWSYEFLSIEAIISDLIGLEIGRLSFLDPFPLLLVTDSLNNFVLVTVGATAVTKYGRRTWRVETIIPQDLPTVTANDGESNTFLRSFGFDNNNNNNNSSPPGSPKLNTVGSNSNNNETKDNNENNNNESSKTNSARPNSEGNKDDGGLFSKRRVRSYLMSKRQVRSLQVSIKNINSPAVVEDSTKKLLDRVKKILKSKIVQKEKDILNGEDSDSDDNDDDNEGDENNNKNNKNNNDDDQSSEISIDMSESSYQLLNPNGSPRESDYEFIITCGYDDGSISVSNISQSIKDTGVEPLTEREMTPFRKKYNPRRIFQKKVAPYELPSKTWTKEEIDANEAYTDCNIEKVWSAHTSSVVSILTIGDKNDIITASDDSAIKLWTAEGNEKAVLTRGKEWDRIFRSFWVTPMNLESRAKRRLIEARVLMNEFELYRVELPVIPNDISAFLLSSSELTKNNKKSNLINSRKNVAVNALPPIKEDSREKTDGRRVLGQLNGEITYNLSNKEFARTELLEKHEKRMEMIRNIGCVKPKSQSLKKRRRKKNNKLNDNNNNSSSAKSAEAKYLDDLMSDNSILSPTAGNISNMIKRSSRVKSKYDMELAKMDEDDLNNWEIHSTNRQRDLYHNLYSEFDKNGLSKDEYSIIKARLSALCPNGNVEEFYVNIKKERSEAKKAINAAMRQGQKTSTGTGTGSSTQVQTDGISDVNLISHSNTNETGEFSLRISVTDYIGKVGISTSELETNDTCGILANLIAPLAIARPPQEAFPVEYNSTDSNVLNDKEFKQPKKIIRSNVMTSPPVKRMTSTLIPEHQKVIPVGNESSQSLSHSSQQSSIPPLYAQVLPVPRILLIPKNDKVIQERIDRTNTVMEFDASIKESEKVFRMAQKQRRQEKKNSKDNSILLRSSFEILNSGARELNDGMLDMNTMRHSLSGPLPIGQIKTLRHAASQIKMSRQSSLEGIKYTELLQIESESNMKKKLDFTLKVMSRTKKELPPAETRQRRVGSPSNTPNSRLYSPPAQASAVSTSLKVKDGLSNKE